MVVDRTANVLLFYVWQIAFPKFLLEVVQVLTLTLLAYILEAFFVTQDWDQALQNTLIPTIRPERVKAATIGSPGGWPIVPVASFQGEQLPYPAGISDLELLTNVPFDAVAYNAIPQLIYMGSADDNDSLDYTDGWDKQDAQVVDRLFGADPLARWEAARLIYQHAGANVQFLLIEGAGHDRRGLQKYSTEFFKKVLDGEKP